MCGRGQDEVFTAFKIIIAARTPGMGSVNDGRKFLLSQNCEGAPVSRPELGAFDRNAYHLETAQGCGKG